MSNDNLAIFKCILLNLEATATAAEPLREAFFPFFANNRFLETFLSFEVAGMEIDFYEK